MGSNGVIASPIIIISHQLNYIVSLIQIIEAR